MNNKINYSGFVEMFMNSSDDFEPYGCADLQLHSSEQPASGCIENEALFRQNLLRELTDQ